MCHVCVFLGWACSVIFASLQLTQDEENYCNILKLFHHTQNPFLGLWSRRKIMIGENIMSRTNVNALSMQNIIRRKLLATSYASFTMELKKVLVNEKNPTFIRKMSIFYTFAGWNQMQTLVETLFGISTGNWEKCRTNFILPKLICQMQLHFNQIVGKRFHQESANNWLMKKVQNLCF